MLRGHGAQWCWKIKRLSTDRRQPPRERIPARQWRQQAAVLCRERGRGASRIAVDGWPALPYIQATIRGQAAQHCRTETDPVLRVAGAEKIHQPVTRAPTDSIAVVQ